MTAASTPQEPAPVPSGGAVEDLDTLVDRLAAEQSEPGAPAAGPAGTAAEADGRPEPPLLAGERETLEGFLDFLRATLLWKAAPLSDEQASRRLVGSDTTVTGMLRHLADTERYWFREVLGGVPLEDVGYCWSDGQDTDREWRLPAGASLRDALDDYRGATEQSRSQLAGREPEEELHGGNEVRTVRWVLTHMVEETARHAGQLDILVELLDGRTGE
ncbi:mini-circle protein [Brachybacterium avium]|uniref:Mini-circle protein n=1 Tax=Brachybacterium avium TaxID=2017485 RepID=A0A220UH14_9MICO|nr:DinB family protein [Brachybacterium avium]ASK67192.1 mini-circle protein [Brachybacterium avium]